jgi:hypothetical protein
VEIEGIGTLRNHVANSERSEESAEAQRGRDSSRVG